MNADNPDAAIDGAQQDDAQSDALIASDAPSVFDGADADAAGVVTGHACARPEDCGEGFDCYTQAPGGYCMPGAPGGPTACRVGDAACPQGTLCSPVPYHAISGVCMRACASEPDCRAGYRCGSVELFPGDPQSPKSEGLVCWPACVPGMNQSCNDSALISSLHGKCLSDGTCECLNGFEKNPDTGRCK